MLQAKSNDGEFITLALLSSRKIASLRKRKQFFCPVCNERVIIKAGTQVTPHFAHQSKSECPTGEYGEGAYHAKGKLHLKRWLKRQGIPVQLEVFIPKINQRPDLFMKLNNRQIAIEFQCARISIKDIQRRNAGYQSAGITPIWILGGKFLKRKRGRLQVSPFILQFIHQFKANYPTTLFYFCPQTIQFHIVSDIYLTSRYRAFHKIRTMKLHNLLFNQLFIREKTSKNVLLSFWESEIRRFRLQPRHTAHGSELNWRKWLYSKGLSIDQLPAFIHLPVASQFLMKVPSWNWQSRICLNIIHPLHVGKTFTLRQCESLLKRYMYDLRYFPLIRNPLKPIHEYLKHLENLQLIHQVSNSVYRKLKPISLYKNIEQALERDNVLLKQLMYNNSQI